MVIKARVNKKEDNFAIPGLKFFKQSASGSSLANAVSKDIFKG